MLATGDYSICRVELQEDSDGLIYHTLSCGYDTETQAAAAVREIAEKNQLALDDIAIIKTISAKELNDQGLLPGPPPPVYCDVCGSRELTFEVIPLESAGKEHGALVQFKICSVCGAKSEHQRLD